MADARVFVAIMVFVIYVESTALSGKGLLCRDPDTGKLHPVNTTWSSTTFCGNYTCKQRRINTTQIQYPPIREFNVTKVIIIDDHEDKTERTETIKPKLDPEPEPDIKQEPEPDIKQEPELDINQEPEPDIKQRINEDNRGKNDTDSNDDRYLTENEIKTIAEMLHTVKKSDLDAIVDIYNLAQEIYKEMDKETDQSDIDKAVNNFKEKLETAHLKLSDIDDAHTKSASYWYDWKERADMDTKTTNIVPTITKLKKNVPTYFNGPLTKKDFGKIPYYYPISSFQRTATYVHQPILPTKSSTIEKPPCQREKAVPKIPANPKDAQKLIKPSYLLPYPFAYVHNYNITKYPNLYYSNPWVWDYYYRNRHSNPYFKAYIAQIPNAVLVNPHLSDQVHTIEQKPVPETVRENQPVEKQKKFPGNMFEKDGLPDWKTEPLSKTVLNEIKANIDTSQLIKAFPLRKKVKVGKVGKVIKMDELMRHKREIEDKILKEGDFEAFVERVTCKAQTEPGFFRFGNLTQPYPHCCPQLILKR